MDKVEIWKEMKKTLEALKEMGRVEVPDDTVAYKLEDLLTKELLPKEEE